MRDASLVEPAHLTSLMLYSPDTARRVLHVPVNGMRDMEGAEVAAELARDSGLLSLFSAWLFSSVVPYGRFSGLAGLPDICVREIEGWDLFDSISEVERCKWISFPVLTCHDRMVRTVWYVAGLAPVENGSVRTYGLDNIAASSVNHAVTALSGTMPGMEGVSLVLFPILHERELPVTGMSAGLPVAIAIKRLMSDMQWPERLFATGALDPAGNVLDVDHVEVKAEYARQKGAFFLFPQGSRVDPGGGTGCLHLQDALDAVDAVSFMSDMSGAAIAIACRENPMLFLENCPHLPADLMQSGFFCVNVDMMRRDVKKFVAPAARALKRVVNDSKKVFFLLDIFSSHALKEVVHAGSDNVDDVIMFAEEAMAGLNHAGAPDRAVEWKRLAEEVCRQYRHDGSRWVHYDMVAARHNRYRFSPDLPDSFMRLMDTEEKIWRAGRRDSLELGSIYGTVAQNYGFCGPAFLGDTLRYAEKAVTAFGNTYAREVKRVVCYMMYALTDAGRTDDALALLPDYLNINPEKPFSCKMISEALSGQAGEKDFPYMAAITFRLLADAACQDFTPGDITGLFAMIKGNDHPVQLAALNAGRLLLAANEPTEAGKWFERSFGICMARGITMRIMMLLPAAYLHANGMASQRHYKAVGERVLPVLGDGAVDMEHFRELLCCNDAGEVLDRVAECPGRWFPFSYR